MKAASLPGPSAVRRIRPIYPSDGDADGDDINCPQCNTLSRATTHPTYPPVFSIHSAHDPRGVQPSPVPPFVSVFPDLRRELGAIVGPSPLLQRPPPSSEQAEPRALRTRLCPLAAGRGPFAKG